MNTLLKAAQDVLASWDDNNSSALVLTNAIKALRQAVDGAEGMVLVPVEPTKAMWDGLARILVLWWSFDKRTGSALYTHLHYSGIEVPQWLQDEIKNQPYVPPKGTVAACIYKAMISAHDHIPAGKPLLDEMQALTNSEYEKDAL